MFDVEEAVEEYLGRCWKKLELSRGEIHLRMVPYVLKDFETVLSNGSLLTSHEKQVLDTAIGSNEYKRINKQDFKDFISKLVLHHSFTSFLKERGGISLFNLVSLLTSPSNRVSSSPLRTSTPTRGIPFSNTRPSSYTDRDDFSLSKRQEQRIADLQMQLDGAERYIETLAKELEREKALLQSRPVSKVDETLVVQQAQEIKQLTDICNQYQTEFEKLKDLNKLKITIQNQNKLIDTLRLKLNLSDNPGKNRQFQDFLVNIPILKQYHMYYKYQKEHKSVGIVLVNAVAVFVTAVILVSLLRIVYFVTLLAFIGDSSYQFTDYADDRKPWLPSLEFLLADSPWLEVTYLRFCDFIEDHV